MRIRPSLFSSIIRRISPCRFGKMRQKRTVKLTPFSKRAEAAKVFLFARLRFPAQSHGFSPILAQTRVEKNRDAFGVRLRRKTADDNAPRPRRCLPIDVPQIVHRLVIGIESKFLSQTFFLRDEFPTSSGQIDVSRSRGRISEKL